MSNIKQVLLIKNMGQPCMGLNRLWSLPQFCLTLEDCSRLLCLSFLLSGPQA